MALTRCPHCNHLTREDRPVCLYCGGELPTVINSGVEPPQADIKQASAPAHPHTPVPPAPPKPSVPQPPVPQPPIPQQAIPQPLQQPVVQGSDTDQPSIAIVIICLLAGLLALGGGIALMLT